MKHVRVLKDPVTLMFWDQLIVMRLGLVQILPQMVHVDVATATLLPFKRLLDPRAKNPKSVTPVRHAI